MNVETLTTKQQVTEATFNENVKQIAGYESKLSALKEEQLKLQGDYRTYTTLIEEVNRPIEEPSPDPAGVIDVSEDKENEPN